MHTELDLDYITAVVGGTVTIETIYGHHDLKIESGTQSGTEIRVFNLGLKSQFSKRLGDHVLTVLFRS